MYNHTIRSGRNFGGRSLPFLLLGLIGISQSACTALWPVLAVPVSLPDFPSVWAGADAWELDWRTQDSFGEALLAHPGDKLILLLPRSGLAAVRCRPVFGNSRGFPWGAIWPYDADSQGRLGLSPLGGVAADLAFRLYQGGGDPAQFNLRRFTVEAGRRLPDPWELDMNILAKAAEEGRFRADYLRPPGRFQFIVFGLAGLMSPESSWGQVLIPDSQGRALLSAAPGTHRWFGPGQVLVAAVSVDGGLEWILRGDVGSLR